MGSISNDSGIENSFLLSPFAGKILDGVAGFHAKLLIQDYCKDTLKVNLISDMEKWTVMVKLEKFQDYPNIACNAFSQTTEWKFDLAQSIDPTTFQYEITENYLVLHADHKVIEVQERGRKRKDLERSNSDFSEKNIKRSRLIRESDKIEEVLENEDRQEPEKEEDGMVNYLPIEIITHILSFLNTSKEVRNCALVNTSWRNAVKLMNLPLVLTINDAFLTPAKYLDFMEVFQHSTKLPFYKINYVYEKPLNISQLNVLEFIRNRSDGIYELNVTLLFERQNGRQKCCLFDWITRFKNCKYLTIRFNDFVPGIPIDYGNCDFSHIKELNITAGMYHQMQSDLRDRFPKNGSLLFVQSDSQ